MSKHGKNRLPPFVPLLIATIDSRAWQALSHGARSLYVSLRRRVPNGKNKAYCPSERRSSRAKSKPSAKSLSGFVS